MIKPSEFQIRLLKKLDKKYLTKGYPIYVPRRRTFNSAMVILQKIEDIPFQKLTLELYFIIKDTGFQKVAEDYKRVIEIAKVQPEKFVFQLYEFYKKEAKYIKDNNLLEKYFDFVATLQEMSELETDTTKKHIYMALVQILLEQTMFLTHNNLDFNKIVVGISTDGNPIESDDIYPNLDLPVYDIEKMIASGKVPSLTDVSKAYHNWGYNVNSIEEGENWRLKSMYYSYLIQYMIPFVNEYTIDILPKKILEPLSLNSFAAMIPSSLFLDFESFLDKRRRTLPTNGLHVFFSNGFFKEILLKEIYKSGQVVMLYKLQTRAGEMSGVYRTRSKFFFSALVQDKCNGFLHMAIKQLILWAYTAYVCDQEGIALTTKSYQSCFHTNEDVGITFTQVGGQLRKVDSGSVAHQKIAGKDGFDSTVKHINGYIRKLPDGQKASENAVQLALFLGYELSPNETFVAPFQRTSWFKVKKINE